MEGVEESFLAVETEAESHHRVEVGSSLRCFPVETSFQAARTEEAETLLIKVAAATIRRKRNVLIATRIAVIHGDVS